MVRMKRLLTALFVVAIMTVPTTALAHGGHKHNQSVVAVQVVQPQTKAATHNGLDCRGWMLRDLQHPNHPWRTYHCHVTGPDSMSVRGQSLYTYKWHVVLLHAHHSDCYLGYCTTTTYHPHFHGDYGTTDPH